MKYEAWVASFVNQVAGYFDFAGWEIEIEHLDKIPDEDKDNVYASILIEPSYQLATIICRPVVREDFKDGNTNRIIRKLTHELVHIFLAPFQDQMEPYLSATTAPLFIKVLEQQTQKLTMVLLKTLPKPLIPPRPKKNGKLNPAPKNNKQKPADDPQQSADLHGAG